MKALKFASIFACCFLFLFLIGSAQSAEKQVVVNLMIDADVPPSPSEEQGYQTEAMLNAMLTEIEGNTLGATIISTQDVLATYTRMRITRIGANPKFELAMSGNNSNEKLSTESYAKQKDVLERSKKYTEGCKYCGINEITVSGFMPQSFDQNADTYKVLDDLGIQYDAGYQAGIIYAPGHELDVWPYKVEGHQFYAVPVSTYNLSGKLVPLQDKYFNGSDLGSNAWYDALTGKFDEAQKNGQPVVIALTTSVSGSGNYLDALKRFLNFALTNKASFVTTMDLVNMTRIDGDHPVASLTKECPTCGKKDNNIVITVSQNNTTEPASIEAAAISKWKNSTYFAPLFFGAYRCLFALRLGK